MSKHSKSHRLVCDSEFLVEEEDRRQHSCWLYCSDLNIIPSNVAGFADRCLDDVNDLEFRGNRIGLTRTGYLPRRQC